ncbi:MAG: 3-deoxy-manno-octulosonate cytidylyltransferase [Geminicoccaceae bacterium]|nr:3-deoxy-manno-octulosonate cytidylyltransferase [Geminicoccaceae bacterium]MCB9945703.1 3-deoxy-manno-octulosonate cytidylyltransferase [Geminicoccaceae bacterium]
MNVPATPASTDLTSRAIVLIPARMASTRLPGKPLALIAGEPMIVHVWRRAMEAGVGRVVVACAEDEIAQAIEAAGGEAIMTAPGHASGTDRVYEALRSVDPDGHHHHVINLQGDMPTLDPASLARVLEPLDELGCDMATLVNATDDEEERTDPNTVKAVVSWSRPELGRALYFTRATAPWGPGPVWHHIGIYAFTRGALDRFAHLSPSPLEQREKLEQLRALENGMSIGVCLVDSVPFGVDTPHDLERARRILEGA